MDPKTPSNPSNKTGRQAQGSGSDTVSAANISAGTSVGNAGQPPRPQERTGQSATLASHTSTPMGGSPTGSGANQARSQGPEHSRHQDKDAGTGARQQAGGARGAGQGSEGLQDRAGEIYEQASEQAGEVYEQATQYAREAYDQASSWASDAYEQGSRYMESARRQMPSFGVRGGSVERFVSENPILVGVVGLAAGLLIGSLLPRTRQEDRTFGRWSDELRDQGMRYARDMAHRGREFVEENLGENDDRFASPGTDWRQDAQRGGQRGGPSGRFQNH